ncbi:alpha/beta hydrolase [Frankia sp. AiPa1]|nr:alpha/beta hydrolase [Frankia sp. AiPa1]
MHGFPDSSWSWRQVAAGLTGHGHRVVAPFKRGYAPTGPAADGSYHVAALTRDLLDLHRHLGSPSDAVVVGHDWGAFVVNALLAECRLAGRCGGQRRQRSGHSRAVHVGSPRNRGDPIPGCAYFLSAM